MEAAVGNAFEGGCGCGVTVVFGTGQSEDHAELCRLGERRHAQSCTRTRASRTKESRSDAQLAMSLASR